MTQAQPDRLNSPWRNRLTWLFPLLVFTGALIVYWSTALLGDNTRSPEMAYFDHLAAAFLQSQLYLANPPATHDLTFYAGQWYVPFPPLPALLMSPWVAWQGLAKTNTVLFSILFGAINVALVYLILQTLSKQRWTRLGQSGNLWLTLLFGLGCVHWYMTTIGSVWFVAQICTVTFVALAVLIAVVNGPAWLAGLALGLAMAARPNVAFTWVLLLGIAATHLREAHGDLNWKRLTAWGLASAIPMGLMILGLLGYNVARFSDPFDFGYANENVARKFIADLRTYGQFDLHFVPRNLWAMWLALPQWNEARHFLEPNPEGMSLLLTTPAMVYLFWSRGRSPLVLGAWAAFILLLIPLALYYNTGWWQFGYRFSLDFMLPVMILLAVAAGQRVSWLMRGLILVGVLVNALGAVWWYSSRISCSTGNSPGSSAQRPISG